MAGVFTSSASELDRAFTSGGLNRSDRRGPVCGNAASHLVVREYLAMPLKVHDLTVCYRGLNGAVRALDGLSLRVEDGEIVTLAGRSGCGKSTLANFLGRSNDSMHYVSGRVELDGSALPLADRPAMDALRYKHIATVPARAISALNPTRRLSSFVDGLLQSRELSYQEAYPDLLRRMEVVGLSPNVLGRYPTDLTEDVRQRMALVIATLFSPSLLIADEPASLYYMSVRPSLGETLHEFRQRSYAKSIIITTRDLTMLPSTADSVIVMCAGRLIEKGPADTVVRRPLHPYTLSLLRSSRKPPFPSSRPPRRPPGHPTTSPPDTGCNFRQQCAFATDRCREAPQPLHVERDHIVACWNWKNLATAPRGPALSLASPAGARAQGREQGLSPAAPERTARSLSDA